MLPRATEPARHVCPLAGTPTQRSPTKNSTRVPHVAQTPPRDTSPSRTCLWARLPLRATQTGLFPSRCQLPSPHSPSPSLAPRFGTQSLTCAPAALSPRATLHVIVPRLQRGLTCDGRNVTLPPIHLPTLLPPSRPLCMLAVPRDVVPSHIHPLPPRAVSTSQCPVSLNDLHSFAPQEHQRPNTSRAPKHLADKHSIAV